MPKFGKSRSQGPARSGEQLASWLVSDYGRRMRNWEVRQLRTVMPRVLGYRMLQLGDWDVDLEAIVSSVMLQHWVLASHRSEYGDLVAEFQQLPIASNSLDAVLLAHSLELTLNPRALLREVDRVLCNRGQIILLGFNPASPWHAGQYLPLRRTMRYPGVRRLYPRWRVCDWLDLLDFEVEALTHYGAVLPGLRDISEYRDPRRWLAPLAPAYMILARKRVLPVTPVRERWRRLPNLGPTVLPEARVSQSVVQLRSMHKT